MSLSSPPATMDEFFAWGLTNDLDHRVLGYLMSNRRALTLGTPSGWVKTSDAMKATGDDVEHRNATIRAALFHEDTADHFIHFMNTMGNLEELNMLEGVVAEAEAEMEAKTRVKVAAAAK